MMSEKYIKEKFVTILNIFGKKLYTLHEQEKVVLCLDNIIEETKEACKKAVIESDWVDEFFSEEALEDVLKHIDEAEIKGE